MLHLNMNMTLFCNLSIHRIRRQIDLAGPRDCAVINEDLLKKPHIHQWRERTCQLFSAAAAHAQLARP